jgi:hypothetical protein
MPRWRTTEESTTDFCIGTSGVIPLFILAAESFKDLSQRLYKAADDAGKIVWEEGLLKKGNGLCHGIAGNAYMLHALYRSNLRRV